MENTVNAQCPICYENKPLRMFHCNHGICPDCTAQLRKPICALCRADNRQDFRPEELAGMDRRNRADRAHRVEQEFQDLRRANPANPPVGNPLGAILGGRVALTRGDWEAVIRRVQRV